MQQLVTDIADAIRAIDRCGVPFKKFRLGVGPYGEPQLMRLVAAHLKEHYPDRYKGIKTKRLPDLLITDQWALEFKIVRPFGDNGIEAEHWSQNLLHPYRGNVSAIGDVYKLLDYSGNERRAILVVSYEHDPPQIEVGTLIAAFEMLTRRLLKLPLGEKIVQRVEDCVHPVHQLATVYGWEVYGLQPADV